MPATRNRAFLVVLALAFGNLALPAQAGGACMDFKWDVSQERALFAGTATAVTAGTDPKSAPIIVPDRLYALRLAGQDHVKFAVAPAKKSTGTAVYAGVATLKLPAQGSYRIAVDLPFWIDVVSNGTLVSAEDFQGQHDCSAPHKIVVFALGSAQPFVLQLSGATQDNVLLTVTAAPARKL
jgi:hypothetical protein